MSNPQTLGSDLRFLLSPVAIRERAARVFELALQGESHFRVHLDRLDRVAELVVETTLGNYPDLKIPFHSRWGHFQVGGVDRLKALNARLAALSPFERTTAKLDLVIVSVLLDAGAGASWKFQEAETGKTFNRSEGLAVASLHLFLDGAFSSDSAQPYRVDAQGLLSLTLDRLGRGFQVSPENPLVGLEGRLKLLQDLGRALVADPLHFGQNPARPGNLLQYCETHAVQTQLPAEELLLAVLLGLGPIWPGRLSLDGVPLGDIWSHPRLGAPGSRESLVPFHKLSQWLTYSLIEPIEEYGIQVTDVDRLTGLAEYRNGGLLLDSGLIELRDASHASMKHSPSSELVIEWRALTVYLLEKIAERVRAKLGRTEEQMPLARVLEGGTWWAGRKLASQLRPGGAPPLQIESDGTVF